MTTTRVQEIAAECGAEIVSGQATASHGQFTLRKGRTVAYVSILPFGKGMTVRTSRIAINGATEADLRMVLA